MEKKPRCLYDSDINSFLTQDKKSIFGTLCEGYHGDALTTTRDAWLGEIEILQNSPKSWQTSEGHIVFEYDIPRLGKRAEAVQVAEKGGIDPVQLAKILSNPAMAALIKSLAANIK